MFKVVCGVLQQSGRQSSRLCTQL